MPSVLDPDAAAIHLAGADPVMAALVGQFGPAKLRDDHPDPFWSLARAIVYQQLSGKAAGTIFGRFEALVSRHGTLDPALVLASSDETLRGAGLSRQKIAAVRSLSEHFASGDISAGLLHEWEDEDVIAHLTRVRGVGRWTAEMFLMFHLRRADVLPVNDLGINRGIMLAYGLPDLPKPDRVREAAAPWRPWATAACWYLWRSQDAATP